MGKMGMASESSDTFLRDYFGTASVLNQVSAVSAGLILAILGVLTVYDAKMVNRISLRLTAGIALVDLMNHLNNVLHRTLGEGDLCVFSGFWRVFGRQLYCFLNISIALNLQLILLAGHRPKPSWEKYYWIISLGVPLVMNLPPLGMFGFNGERCYVRDVDHREVLLTINISLVILATLIYCTFISALVMFRLRAKLAIVRNLSPNQDMDQHIQRQVEKSLKRLIFRISLYPFTCVISLLVYFVATVWNVFFEENSTLIVVAMFSLTLTGFLNLIAFLCDPSLHSAVRAMVASSRERFYSSRFSESSSNLFLSPKPEISHRTSIHGDNNLRLL